MSSLLSTTVLSALRYDFEWIVMQGRYSKCVPAWKERMRGGRVAGWWGERHFHISDCSSSRGEDQNKEMLELSKFLTMHINIFFCVFFLSFLFLIMTMFYRVIFKIKAGLQVKYIIKCYVNLLESHLVHYWVTIHPNQWEKSTFIINKTQMKRTKLVINAYLSLQTPV